MTPLPGAVCAGSRPGALAVRGGARSPRPCPDVGVRASCVRARFGVTPPRSSQERGHKGADASATKCTPPREAKSTSWQNLARAGGLHPRHTRWAALGSGLWGGFQHLGNPPIPQKLDYARPGCCDHAVQCRAMQGITHRPVAGELDALASWWGAGRRGLLGRCRLPFLFFSFFNIGFI
jgi:hypothetical protein